MNYYEARRQARSLLGQHADVEEVRQPVGLGPRLVNPEAPGAPVPPPLFYPYRVGVWVEVAQGRKEFQIVGLGNSFEEALADAKQRQMK